MVDVDEVEIVELLQHEVRRVVENVGALVALQRVEKALKGGSVENIFAGMYLVSDVDARIVEGVEDRPPAFGELLESGLDEARSALGPWIDEGPGKRAGERRMGL